MNEVRGRVQRTVTLSVACPPGTDLDEFVEHVRSNGNPIERVDRDENVVILATFTEERE